MNMSIQFMIGKCYGSINGNPVLSEVQIQVMMQTPNINCYSNNNSFKYPTEMLHIDGSFGFLNIFTNDQIIIEGNLDLKPYINQPCFLQMKLINRYLLTTLLKEISFS